MAKIIDDVTTALNTDDYDDIAWVVTHLNECTTGLNIKVLSVGVKDDYEYVMKLELDGPPDQYHANLTELLSRTEGPWNRQWVDEEHMAEIASELLA